MLQTVMRFSTGFLSVSGFGLLGLGLWACGGDETPNSTVGMGQAGGGMAGAAGTLLLGGGGAGGAGGAAGGTGGALGGSAGSGGAPMPEVKPPVITLHTCPATPEPACPAKPMAGNVQVTQASDFAELEGVTSIEGRLRLYEVEGIEALSCLETVGDDLEIDQTGLGGDLSLWGLRNLQSIGGDLEITSTTPRIFADCAFSRLASTGAMYLTGGAVDGNGPLAGDWDFSPLTQVRHIRFRNTSVEHVKLPSDEMLSMGQLLFEKSPYLSEVAGFEGVTIKATSTLGSYSVRIMDNPFFSTCRANELAKLFTDGGAEPATVMISNNLPCAM